MAYQWRSGSMFSAKVDAGEAYAELQRIKEREGELDAEVIVKAAKRKRNVLHAAFEWNDAAAAHEHRLSTARKIVHSIVEVRDDLSTDRPQRAFLYVRRRVQKPDKPKHVYKTTAEAMADPDLRAEVLGRALKELISFRNRFRDLQELAIVMREIDALLETVET